MLTKTDLNTNKTQIILNFMIFALPVILLTNFFFSYVTNLQTEIINEKYRSRQRELVSNSEFQINAVFTNVSDDMNLVLNSNEFQDFIDNPVDKSLFEAQKMFYRVLKSKKDIMQLRYIDSSGMEIIRVERHAGEIIIVDNNLLQDKSNRYYHKSFLAMKDYGLYVSDFDLNVENGEYVRPYEPVIRFSVPVIKDTKRIGYIILNFDGFAFLNILSEYEDNKTASLELGILDRNHLIGFNLVGSDQELSESFLYEEDEKNKARSEIYKETEKSIYGYFNLDSKSFYYRRIEGPKGLDLRLDPISEAWILISSYDTGNILQEDGSLLVTHSTEIRLVILSIIAILIFIIVSLAVQRHNDDLLLLASGYISEYTHDGIIITDRHRRIIYCNQVFEHTFGYSLSQIKGKRPGAFLSGQTTTEFDKIIYDGDVWEGNLWDITANNTYILKYLKIKAIYDSRKKIAFYIGIYSEPKMNLTDSTDDYLVSHHFIGTTMDFLTPAFRDKFDMIDKKAVIVVKMNEFNLIRSYITDAEDNEVINTISSSFHDIIAIGGMVIIPASGMILIVAPIQSGSSLHLLMEKINSSIMGIKFSVNTNIPIDYISGVAVSPEHGKSGSELINNAFIALEALIKMKKSRYLIYNQDVYDLVKKDKVIRDEIEDAFDNNEFSVVYQLQQNVETEEITGAEVLVRWKSPNIGWVSPNSFVPIMEESGQIVRLGRYVMKIVAGDFTNLVDLLPKDFRISINLSSQEFNNSEIISDLLQIIDESGLPRTMFCFEITETTIVDNIKFTNMVAENLHSEGIIVAIDDFGTGYSSLSYLKELESDKIKIDRMFIKDYPESDDGKIFISIVNMIKSVSKKIIVEGVETTVQLEFIKENGCEEFQGFLSHKPMAIDQFMTVLKLN